MTVDPKGTGVDDLTEGFDAVRVALDGIDGDWWRVEMEVFDSMEGEDRDYSCLQIQRKGKSISANRRVSARKT